jgi:hypothetical protein
MTRPAPRVLVTDRQAGKTEYLIQWLLKGETVPVSPGWSRIVLCAFETVVPLVIDRIPVGHPARHAVYSIEHMRGIRPGHGIEYAVDDVEALIYRSLPLSLGLPTIMTMSGSVETQEKPHARQG